MHICKKCNIFLTTFKTIMKFLSKIWFLWNLSPRYRICNGILYAFSNFLIKKIICKKMLQIEYFGILWSFVLLFSGLFFSFTIVIAGSNIMNYYCQLLPKKVKQTYWIQQNTNIYYKFPLSLFQNYQTLHHYTNDIIM